MPDNKSKEAQIDWTGGATLRSTTFDDIYFSDMGGLAEARHVFLQGNDLEARLSALADAPAHQVFTVGELGFGTGLNLLALWDLWNRRDHSHGHLHFVSVEGFPLGPEDFKEAQARIAANWSELAPLCRQLADHYPVPVRGRFILPLAKDVTVTLLIEEVESALAELEAKIDAWFLDGFSPKKNPAMWTPEVMTDLARCSRPDTTLATFTVAGAVRRTLTEAMFAVKKNPGFGHKRDMLVGTLEDGGNRAARKKNPKPWFSYQSLPDVAHGPRVLIAGAGIAGACLAWHLTRAGFDVTVYDRDNPGAGASGNPVGLIFPRLDLGDTVEAQFYRTAWLHAISFIEQLEKETGTEIFTQRGGLMLALTDEESKRHVRRAREQLLPDDMMSLVSSPEAIAMAGIDLTLDPAHSHLWFPHAGTVDPAQYLQALFSDISVRPGTLVSYDAQHKGSTVKYSVMTDDKQQTLETDYLMIANALRATSFLPDVSITGSLGQLDILDLPPPEVALLFGHYAVPLGNRTATGATYEPCNPETEPYWSEENSAANLAALAQILPQGDAIHTHQDGRAAIRCVTPDQHPVVGAIPKNDAFHTDYTGLKTGLRASYPTASYENGVFTLTALGSRGLVTAPLCAAFIEALITSAPSPLPTAQSDLLHPARFLIRSLKRNQ